MQIATNSICKNKIKQERIFKTVALFLSLFALYDMSRAEEEQKLLILCIDSVITIRLTIGKIKDNTVEKTKTNETEFNCLSADFRSSSLIDLLNVETKLCCCKNCSFLTFSFKLLLQI